MENTGGDRNLTVKRKVNRDRRRVSLKWEYYIGSNGTKR